MERAHLFCMSRKAQAELLSVRETMATKTQETKLSTLVRSCITLGKIT